MLALVKRLPGLRAADLSRCIGLTDKSVVALLRACSELQSLNLNSLDKITEKTLAALCKFGGRLEELDLSFCRLVGLCDEWVDRLAEECVSLRQMHVWGCIRLTECALQKP